jgi:predicted phosphate transport protein (TIGR00153 family)
MGLNSIIKAFLPKDKVFYNIFEQVGANLKEMSSNFHIALKEPNIATRNKMLLALEDGEHANDDLTHKVFIELGQNFITPFDREDIHYLATSLDDVADYIYASSKKIVLYQVKEIDEYMIGMGRIVENSTHALAKALHELRNMKNLRAITESCVVINSFENEADDLLDKAVGNLFENSNIPAVEIIKLKEIYQDMEIITDKCEDAANVIESIIIKYS